jgi:hypothetical protein
VTKASITVDTDEPVLVLVVPLRKCRSERPTPAHARRVIDTTAEPADNVIPLRRAVGA